MADLETQLAAIITALPEGRANAISISALCAKLPGNPGGSTVRRRIHHLQEHGFGILSSPRAGIWICADDGERLDLIEELRHQVAAIERAMARINDGRCALRSCRATLPPKVVARGGLFCQPNHRYLAAVERQKKQRQAIEQGRRRG